MLVKILLIEIKTAREIRYHNRATSLFLINILIFNTLIKAIYE